MLKNSSLIYKLFNTSCIDIVVNIVSKYSVKLSLEFFNIFIRNSFFISANLIIGFVYFLIDLQIRNATCNPLI